MSPRVLSPAERARLLVVAAAPLPLLALLAVDLWHRPHYAFALVAPLAALLLAARRLRAAGPPQPGGRTLGTALAVTAWGLLAAAAVLYSPRGGAAAALVGAAAPAWDVRR